MIYANETIAREAFHRLLTLLRYFRRYARRVKGEGISLRDYSVLRFLLESGPSRVGQIQAFLYRSPSTTSVLIAHMEEQGYVTRTRSQQDNRVVIVDLTPAGRKMAERTPLGGIPLFRRRLATLSEERQRHINEALAEIMQLLEVPENG
jgi:DNA-binding MarR family transcriptional regulator